jgi:DNA-binding LacI/PurR family transcriptional regulator
MALSDPMQQAKSRPKQADIARLAGVSVSTVSRVLSHEPGISESVRQSILAAAQELGYPTRPGNPARLAPIPASLALLATDQATGGLGIFYEGILDGMRDAFVREQALLETRLVGYSGLTTALAERLLVDTGAEALFLVGLDPSEELVQWSARRQLPVVLVNGTDPSMRCDGVAPANFNGAMLATRHLLNHGHRRLLHVSISDRPTIRERRRGFLSAIAAEPGAESEVIVLDRASDTGSEIMKALNRGAKRPTAVFCMNDMMAVDCLEAAGRIGLRVPEDLSIIGFDNLPCAAMTAPRLTTMEVDRVEIGREAARLIRQRLSHPQAPPRTVEIAVVLRDGGTVSWKGTP